MENILQWTFAYLTTTSPDYGQISEITGYWNHHENRCIISTAIFFLSCYPSCNHCILTSLGFGWSKIWHFRIPSNDFASCAHISLLQIHGTQRRSDRVDLCEINYLGSSLIDFCISTGKHFWVSPGRAPLLKSRFKVGSSRGKG